MDTLTLIVHLSRRRSQLQREWVQEAGAYYLLTQGFSFEDAPGLIPLPIAEYLSEERELELRRLSLEDTKRRLDELDAEIRRIADQETTP